MKSIFLASLCLISSAIMMTSCSNGDYTASPDKSGASNPIYQPTPIGVNGTGGRGGGNNGGGGTTVIGGSHTIGSGSFTWTEGGTNYTANNAFCYDTTIVGMHYLQIYGIQGMTNASNVQGKYVLFQIINFSGTTGTIAIGDTANAAYYDIQSATVQKVYTASSGSINITAFGGVGTYVKGTFSFNATGVSNNVSITNGNFNIKRY